MHSGATHLQRLTCRINPSSPVSICGVIPVSRSGKFGGHRTTGSAGCSHLDVQTVMEIAQRRPYRCRDDTITIDDFTLDFTEPLLALTVIIIQRRRRLGVAASRLPQRNCVYRNVL